MSLNVGDQEYNGGKKYRQKGTLCGPNNDGLLPHGSFLRGYFESMNRQLSNACEKDCVACSQDPCKLCAI